MLLLLEQIQVVMLLVVCKAEGMVMAEAVVVAVALDRKSVIRVRFREVVTTQLRIVSNVICLMILLRLIWSIINFLVLAQWLISPLRCVCSRLVYGFDATHLATLKTLHVGDGTGLVLQRHPLLEF